jgi:hypothetical protein
MKRIAFRMENHGFLHPGIEFGTGETGAEKRKSVEMQVDRRERPCKDNPFLSRVVPGENIRCFDAGLDHFSSERASTDAKEPWEV